MSATSLQIVTLCFPNPEWANGDNTFQRINSSLSFNYLTSFDLRTLSTNGADPGSDITGLLYTPDLPPGDPCINASAPYVPANATRQINLPNEDYDLIALAPWTSPECTTKYLQSAHQDPIRAFLFFLPNNSTASPPESDTATWSLGDNGAWKSQNQYPVYAIPGASGNTLMQASAQYSKNMTDVPYGHQLTEYYDSRDYVRLFADINTGGGTTLPSLWVFLLVVLGILLAIIGCTSLLMHWLQRRRRQALRRRVANGEVDLEALGIKRLTVPQEILDKMPLYTYGSGAPVAPTSIARETTTLTQSVSPSKLAAADHDSRPTSPIPQRTSATPPPAILRTSSYNPSPLQQPTCAICLDDFVLASTSTGTEGTIVRELPCHHIFHPECVDTFLKDSSSLCPMCKKTALPKGYCPRVVTNAMVRRERLVRRIRPEEEETEVVDEERLGPLGLGMGRRRSTAMRSLSTMNMNMNWRTGRRISSAPVQSTTTTTSQPMTELSTPSSATAPISPVPPPATSALTRSTTTASSAVRRAPAVQPPANPNRREWARQRAERMLGRRAPIDPDVEEARGTPGWRKALRGIFPGLGR